MDVLEVAATLVDHHLVFSGSGSVRAFRTCKLAVRHVEVGVQGNPVGHRMPRARCRLCMAPKVLESGTPERSRVRLPARQLPLLRLLRPLPWLLLFRLLQLLLPLILSSCKLHIRPGMLPLKAAFSSSNSRLSACCSSVNSSCPPRYGSSAGRSSGSQLLC